MDDIRRILDLASRRLELTSFVGAFHVTAMVAAAVALVLAIADRLPATPFVAWAWVLPVLVAGALIAALVIWSRRRRTELQVALAVDERLDLREKLSTALQIARRDDAFAQAALEDAVLTARDPRSRERVRRFFTVAAPSRWWISPLALVVMIGVLLLPQADLFADEDAAVNDLALKEAKVASENTIEVVVRSVEDKPQLSQELADLVDDLSKPGLEPDAVQRPEQIKRETLKKLTKLNDRLNDIMNGEKGKTAEAIERMMSKLQTPDGGPADELAKALAKGDFSEAKKALEELMAQAEAGELDPAKQKELADQLAQIGEQLEQLARQQEQLAKALQQAGLNPQLANSPQALQQAIQQAQNLNQQQKQQLQQMMQAQQQAQQMCQGLGGACQQMAQALNNGQQMGPGGQQMMNQLTQLEQMQMLLQQAQAAASQCQGQGQALGQGMAQGQQWMQGGGMGNWGQGAGGKARLSPTPTGTKLTKADAPLVDGEIIASMLIDGTPFRGESKAKLKQVVARAAEGYDEALSEDPLPRQYHEAQKHYFGELQRQVEAVARPEGDAGDDAPAGGTGAPPSNDGPANDDRPGG